MRPPRASAPPPTSGPPGTAPGPQPPGGPRTSSDLDATRSLHTPATGTQPSAPTPRPAGEPQDPFGAGPGRPARGPASTPVPGSLPGPSTVGTTRAAGEPAPIAATGPRFGSGLRRPSEPDTANPVSDLASPSVATPLVEGEPRAAAAHPEPAPPVPRTRQVRNPSITHNQPTVQDTASRGPTTDPATGAATRTTQPTRFTVGVSPDAGSAVLRPVPSAMTQATTETRPHPESGGPAAGTSPPGPAGPGGAGGNGRTFAADPEALRRGAKHLDLIHDIAADIAAHLPPPTIYAEGHGPIATAIHTKYEPNAISSEEFIKGLTKLLVFNSDQVTALLHVVTDVDTSTRDTAHGLGEHPPVR